MADMYNALYIYLYLHSVWSALDLPVCVYVCRYVWEKESVYTVCNTIVIIFHFIHKALGLKSSPFCIFSEPDAKQAFT